MDSAQLAVAVVGVAGVLIGLWYAGVQLRDSRMSARGTFLLELDTAFVRHDATHRRLRGGDWAKPRSGPKNREEWADVEAYMGLFERIEVLIDGGVLDASLVNRLCGYRVKNIVDNEKIRREKLIRRADGWSDFRSLMVRLEWEGRRFEW